MREKPLIDYAGTITSCIANEKDIVIKGTLKPEYANKKVYIYETNIINYNNSLNGLKVVGEAFHKEVTLLSRFRSRTET